MKTTLHKFTAHSASVITIDYDKLCAIYVKRKDSDVFADEIKFSSLMAAEEYVNILKEAGYEIAK